MKQCITVVLLLWSVALNAQGYKIKRSWAFVTESMPGNIIKDDSGNDAAPVPITERFVYIETNYKGEPRVDGVYYNGKLYQAVVVAVPGSKQTVGNSYSNGKPFSITKQSANRLWKITVVADNSIPPRFGTVKTISIKGKLGSSSFKQMLYTETRLSGPEYQ